MRAGGFEPSNRQNDLRGYVIARTQAGVTVGQRAQQMGEACGLCLHMVKTRIRPVRTYVSFRQQLRTSRFVGQAREARGAWLSPSRRDTAPHWALAFPASLLREPQFGARPSRHSRNNKSDTHVAIHGTTSESRKRYKPVVQLGRGGNCLRLHHGNHGIDVCGLEPESLLAVDLSLCQLRQVLGKALLERLP